MSGPGPTLLEPDDLAPVVAALRAGQVVGLPTDTVYGLGVILDAAPIGRLFNVKGRPHGMALPVLIGEWRQIDAVASAFPATASALAEAFWPGPLTLVVPARRRVGRLVGGDGRTVGLRWPAAPLVEELCLLAGPLAVTSANRHGAAPATAAEVVVATFTQAEVAAVVAGAAPGGTPSSVVDCAAATPGCLREGAIAWEELQAVLPAR